jgi:hypothetical protein
VKGRDRGAVTVEAAIGLSVLVLVLAMVIAAIGAVTAKLRCVDAAREAARQVARGDPELAAEAVHDLAPPGAGLSVSEEDGTIRVEVSADSSSRFLPGLTTQATAVALKEPNAEPSKPAAEPVSVPAGDPASRGDTVPGTRSGGARAGP